MVRWLTAQQNPYGGFGSTRDTIVALQALSKYSMLTFSPDSSPVITVTNTNGFNHVFTVNSHNRLLLQQKDLPDIPGDYSVSVTGSGCALVQFVLRYNIPQPDTGGAFSLSAETKAINCPPHPLPKFALTLTFSYTGTREASNMVVIEVDLLTGYVALQEVINDILTVKVIKRAEITKSSVIIYAEER
ncbi:ovostatin-like [Spea bombifrons]|uniref:ovostatin-like n=1 Tax=Spea bombifrons TaxID=233779 RepID=UPI00234B5B18|nr:ovostatin-like [Spea bombifrons]